MRATVRAPLQRSPRTTTTNVIVFCKPLLTRARGSRCSCEPPFALHCNARLGRLQPMSSCFASPCSRELGVCGAHASHRSRSAATLASDGYDRHRRLLQAPAHASSGFAVLMRATVRAPLQRSPRTTATNVIVFCKPLLTRARGLRCSCEPPLALHCDTGLGRLRPPSSPLASPCSRELGVRGAHASMGNALAPSTGCCLPLLSCLRSPVRRINLTRWFFGEKCTGWVGDPRLSATLASDDYDRRHRLLQAPAHASSWFAVLMRATVRAPLQHSPRTTTTAITVFL
jgi:hypothetical protein